MRNRRPSPSTRRVDACETSVAGRESVAHAPSSRSTRARERPTMSDSASAHGPSTTWPRTSRPYTSTASGRARTASASSVSPDGSVNASTRVAGSQRGGRSHERRVALAVVEAQPVVHEEEPPVVARAVSTDLDRRGVVQPRALHGSDVDPCDAGCRHPPGDGNGPGGRGRSRARRIGRDGLADRDPRRRSADRPGADRALQPLRPVPQPRRQLVGADRGPAEAAVGPDPEPRRDGEGLRAARARHVRGGHRGARRTHSAHRARRRPRRPKGSWVRRSGACSRSPRPTRSCRRTRTSGSCSPSWPRRRTASPSPGRSTTTPSSRTTTRSRRSRVS